MAMTAKRRITANTCVSVVSALLPVAQVALPAEGFGTLGRAAGGVLLPWGRMKNPPEGAPVLSLSEYEQAHLPHVWC